MTYGRWSFGMATRVQGATHRAHLALAAKRGNVAAKNALRAPPLPPRFRYLWEWFMELHGRRGTGMNGPASLTWGDFDAWARRTARAPTPWEFRMLAALDDGFFAAVAEQKS